MSLSRLVYYSAVVGGWAALLGWLIAEFAFLRNSTAGSFEVALAGALVGGAIGSGLGAVAGVTSGQWKQIVQRMGPGLVGGGLGGVVGGILGNFLFSSLGWPRALGWLIMGLGIGVVEGLYERSTSKARNGLIGGGIGGLVGGILFDPMLKMIQSGSGMSSRATAFVILGVCIGALIGLVQVVLKEAWLTVVDGYRAGRQLILSRPVTILGRGDHVPLPFLGPMNKDLDAEHVRISRQTSGSYVVEDNHTRLGTRVNGNVIQAPVTLKDGDVIKFGTNFVRFNERHRKAGSKSVASQAGFNAPVPHAPPPPPLAAAKRDLDAPQETRPPVAGAMAVGSAPAPRAAEPVGAPNPAPKAPVPTPVAGGSRTPPPAPQPPRVAVTPATAASPPSPKPTVPPPPSARTPGSAAPPGSGTSSPAPARPISIPAPPPPPPRKT